MSKKSKKHCTDVITVYQRETNLKPNVKVIPEPVVRPKLIKSTKICDNKPKLIEYNKYSEPIINSTLRYAKAVLDEERKLCGIKKLESLSDLTPYEQKLITKQIAKKLNIPQGVCIFKDLIPLDVNIDELVRYPTYKNYSKRTKRQFTKKDIEPQLADFYQPKKRDEYKVVVDVPNIKSRPVRSFDTISLYQKMSSWNMDDSL